MSNYIIIPAEHKDLVTIDISSFEKVVPLEIIDGDHIGDYAIEATLPLSSGYESLAAALAAEPLVSTVIEAELANTDLFEESEPPQ